MAIELSKLTGFLDEIGVNYDERDENTIVFPYSNDDDKILVVVKLMEDGEFLQMRTLKHLDDLVAEASEEKRNALLKWMLNKNYTTKMGTWEYDPEDHDHHIAIGCSIEDNDLTIKQFARMFKAIIDSVKVIPEMKEILGIMPAEDDLSEKEKKRQELLRQLQDLDEDGI